MDIKTPVAFFIFNRPDTTEKVFEAIRGARPPKLLVVADGPRAGRPDEAERCAAVRAVIDRVDWPCEVLTNYADANMGCKKRISSGLDWVFTMVEEAIILEDDCLPHPDFFRFCELMLERYRDDERVMMIGGTNYLLDTMAMGKSYLFSRYYPIWGWATWRRAWRAYDITMKDWGRLKAEGQLNSFYTQAFMRKYVASMFDAAASGCIDTWDIQWFYTCLFNNGVCAIPRVNLISNIGLVGTHTSGDTSNNLFPVFGMDVNDLKHPDQVYPDFAYDGEFFSKKLKTGAIDFLRKVCAATKKRCRAVTVQVKQ